MDKKYKKSINKSINKLNFIIDLLDDPDIDQLIDIDYLDNYLSSISDHLLNHNDIYDIYRYDMIDLKYDDYQNIRFKFIDYQDKKDPDLIINKNLDNDQLDKINFIINKIIDHHLFDLDKIDDLIRFFNQIDLIIDQDIYNQLKKIIDLFIDLDKFKIDYQDNFNKFIDDLKIKDLKLKISNGLFDINQSLDYQYQNDQDIYNLDQYNKLLDNINRLISNFINKG